MWKLSHQSTPFTVFPLTANLTLSENTINVNSKHFLLFTFALQKPLLSSTTRRVPESDNPNRRLCFRSRPHSTALKKLTPLSTGLYFLKVCVCLLLLFFHLFKFSDGALEWDGLKCTRCSLFFIYLSSSLFFQYYRWIFIVNVQCFIWMEVLMLNGTNLCGNKINYF